MKVELGKRYRDRVTGFDGVAVSKTEYIQGCYRICLEKLNEKGDGIISLVFDEPNLELIGPAVVESPAPARARTGGPHDHGSTLDLH